MKVSRIVIKNPEGIHLSMAADIANLAWNFKSRIRFCHGFKSADICSIIELLTLSASKDSEIAVIAEGPDEKEAVKEIRGLFEMEYKVSHGRGGMSYTPLSEVSASICCPTMAAKRPGISAFKGAVVL